MKVPTEHDTIADGTKTEHASQVVTPVSAQFKNTSAFRGSKGYLPVALVKCSALDSK
jgi:hypothetical protein